MVILLPFLFRFCADVYEIQAAIACVLCGFHSQVGPLPRILRPDFRMLMESSALRNGFEGLPYSPFGLVWMPRIHT